MCSIYVNCLMFVAPLYSRCMSLPVHLCLCVCVILFLNPAIKSRMTWQVWMPPSSSTPHPRGIYQAWICSS